MHFSQALFYPWIDISDEAWLKTAALYWERIRTIVPESIDTPYSSATARALEDEHFLVPLRVNSDMEEIEKLTDDVIAYLGTEEGTQALLLSGQRSTYVHTEKLPNSLRRLTELHPEKLPWAIRDSIEQVGLRTGRRGEWFELDDAFANYYMTLLATKLSERIGASLLTPQPVSERLAMKVKLDANIADMFINQQYRKPRRWREYEADGPRRMMPRELAPGMLAHLAIERVGVAPDTPVRRLIEFRRDHADELSRFRNEVAALSAAVDSNLSATAIREAVGDIYHNQLKPAKNDLKRALKSKRIQSISDGLLKVGTFSAASTSMLVVSGLSVPIALLAGAGISLVVTKVLYSTERARALRENPCSYLLSLERHFN
jgi:hypothetical protein